MAYHRVSFEGSPAGGSLLEGVSSYHPAVGAGGGGEKQEWAAAGGLVDRPIPMEEDGGRGYGHPQPPPHGGEHHYSTPERPQAQQVSWCGVKAEVCGVGLVVMMCALCLLTGVRIFF